MANVELVINQGDNQDTKVFIMSQNIKGLSLYERAKAINKFLEKETKVLETAIENYLRSIFVFYGIVPRDGSESALMESFYKLNAIGKDIVIGDRYNATSERIIGEKNHITVILEEDILSAAMEVEIVDYE